MIKINRTPPTTPTTISTFSPCGGGSVGIKASDNERKKNDYSCFSMLLELQTDHYFLRVVEAVVLAVGEGRVALGFEHFPKTIPPQQKTAKNIARGTVGNHQKRAFYLPEKFKKILGQVTDHEKNYAQPECEKRCAPPRKLSIPPTTTPLKKKEWFVSNEITFKIKLQ